MKRYVHIFLYLNIYIAASALLPAQEIVLELQAERPLRSSFVDSLQLPAAYDDIRSMQKALEGMDKRLQQWGFLQAGIEQLEKENDSTYRAQVFIGPRYRSLKVRYRASQLTKSQLRKVSPRVEDSTFYLDFPSSRSALEQLNRLTTANGNPFARLRLVDFTPKRDTLVARLQLERGASRQIDSIAVRGYDRFPRSFIKHYAGIRTEKPFDRARINRQNEQLAGLGFVSSTRPPEVLFGEDRTTLFLYLKRQNNNLFDGILGFTTDEDSGNVRLNGYLNLELNNNLHFGEQLLVNFKADGRDQQNFRARVRLPYLFSTPIGAELELRIFKRDSTFSTTDQSARLTYQISPALSSSLGYRGTQSSNLQNELLGGSAVEDYDGRFLQAGLEYARFRDDQLWPVNVLARLTTEFGNRDRNTGSDQQTRASLQSAYLLRLNYNNAIFLGNSTAVLFSDSYLTNELSRFGGILNMRGFDENSIDASLFSVLNTEYRYRFNEGFFVHTIIDLAYFENQIASLEEQLYSFGFGFGFLSKAGVLRLQVANGNSGGQKVRFSNTKIHLSLTAQF